MHNKVFYCKMIFTLIIFLNLNCGFVKRDYYSKPVNNAAANGHLLRGSGWTDWKYGYAVNNVNQYENSDFIIDVQIDNFYTSYWAMGPFIFTVIPTFGLIKEYNQNDEEYRKIHTRVVISIFLKNKKKYNLNICEIALLSDNEKNYPERFHISYLEQINEICECKNRDIVKEFQIAENNAYDIIMIILDFKTVFTPDQKGKIIFPVIKNGKLKIIIPEFQFEPGSGFIWGLVL